ncbi:HAD-IA family hydrolase, partial [Acidaminococcus fermentans]
MAIVTSKFKASCQRGLRCLGLEDCIDGIIGCQECTAHKPDPEPMEKGLELLGLRGEECLCVGDSPYDLVSGKKAGCRTVKVGWTSFSQDFFDRFIRPDHTIGTLKDLLSFVEPSKPER